MPRSQYLRMSQALKESISEYSGTCIWLHITDIHNKKQLVQKAV